MRNNILRFIGDAHGLFHKYKNLIFDVDYSIQIGDFGFKEAWENLIKDGIDSNHHKVLGGNHDDYGFIYSNNPPHFLGEFGEFYIEDFKVFFVRGGFSIDYTMRIEGVSIWREEQLNYLQMERCIDVYTKSKPNILITHCPPDGLMQRIHGEYYTPIKSSTGALLHELYQIHQPTLWIYGHMHPPKNFIKKVGDTNFVCLSELGVLNYDLSRTLEENINIFNNTLSNKH